MLLNAKVVLQNNLIFHLQISALVNFMFSRLIPKLGKKLAVIKNINYNARNGLANLTVCNWSFKSGHKTDFGVTKQEFLFISFTFLKKQVK